MVSMLICLGFLKVFRSAASPHSVLFGDVVLFNNRGSCSKVAKVLAVLLFGVVLMSRVSTLHHYATYSIADELHVQYSAFILHLIL